MQAGFKDKQTILAARLFGLWYSGRVSIRDITMEQYELLCAFGEGDDKRQRRENNLGGGGEGQGSFGSIPKSKISRSDDSFLG